MYNGMMPTMGVPDGAYTQPVRHNPRSPGYGGYTGHGGAFGLGNGPSPMAGVSQPSPLSPYAGTTPPSMGQPAAPAPAAMMAPSVPTIPGQPTAMDPNASSMGMPPVQQQPRASAPDPYTGRYGAIANALLA